MSTEFELYLEGSSQMSGPWRHLENLCKEVKKTLFLVLFRNLSLI